MLALLVSVGEGATEDLWEGAPDSSRVFWYEGSMSHKLAQLLDNQIQFGQPSPPSICVLTTRGGFRVLLSSKAENDRRTGGQAEWLIVRNGMLDKQGTMTRRQNRAN